MHIQMEVVNSAPMQLGRWGFVEAPMFMFRVADGYGRDRHTRTQQPTAVAARVLLCALYLCIAGFRRNIKYVRTLEIANLTALTTTE